LVVASAYFLAVAGKAQMIAQQIKPDVTRALKAAQHKGPHTRRNSYQPSRNVSQLALRPRIVAQSERQLARVAKSEIVTSAAAITGGTALTNVLHTSQLSMTSSAGTDEQFVDRTNDLIADDRTTFDSAGGSFDIAVGRSGTRYEVFSATLNNNKIGVLVLANDTTWTFDILIVARRTDVDGENASYRFVGCIKRDTNATSTAIVGAVAKTGFLAQESEIATRQRSVAAATGTAGAGLKIVLFRQATQLESFGDILVDRFLHLLHLLARIEKTLRSWIGQECLPAVLKLRDLLVRQGEALLLLELENLSLFTQELVL
jgi:hypothetical protein